MDSTTQADNEYTDEELILYVDFETKLLDDQISNPNLKIKMLGIDSNNPILQINNKIFKGSYDYAMGVNIFFSESAPSPDRDPNFRETPERMYEYFAKTDKVLKMKRIFAKEIDPHADSLPVSDGEIENIENLRIQKTYGDALNQFLKGGEIPPRYFTDEMVDNSSIELTKLFDGTSNLQNSEIDQDVLIKSKKLNACDL